MILVNGREVKIGKFPNNESFIDADFEIKGGNEENKILFKYENDAEFIYLKFLVNEITYQNGMKHEYSNITLEIPYLPYSRMDRREEKRLFTLKSVAKFINDLCVDKVIIWEPHSAVSTQFLRKLEVKNVTAELTEKFIKERNLEDAYIVYPDAGAANRYKEQLNYTNVIECEKIRDFNTGRITTLEIKSDKDLSKCKTAIIIDDLCSRGGTFLMTAKALKDKGVEEIYLVVTHCEDTVFNGELLITDYIKQIVTTDSILTKEHDKILITKGVMGNEK